MKFKIRLLSFLIVLYSTSTFCQNSPEAIRYIDSLMLSLKTSSNNEKSAIYLEISERYSRLNSDSSLMYANKAYSYAIAGNDNNIKAEALMIKGKINIYKKFYPRANVLLDSALLLFTELNDNKRISDAHSSLAHLSMRMGKLDNAITHLSSSILFLKEINDTNSIATIRNNMGIIYTRKGDYVKALEYLYSSIEYFETQNSPKQLADGYMNISNVYSKNQDLDKAIEYSKKALVIYKDLGYKTRVADLSFNMANIYNMQKKWDLALEHINTFIEIRTESGDNRMLGEAYGAIGIIYRDKGRYDSALYSFNKALAICLESNDSIKIAEQYTNLAKLNYLTKHYNKAIQYANRANDFSNQHHIALNSYNTLYISYLELGNFEKAFRTKEVYYALQDSINGLEVQKQLDELETKYETARKEKEITELRDENNKKEIALLQARQSLYLFVGLSVVLILVAIFIIFYSRTIQKQKQNEIKVQKTDFENRLLRAQINPHFIFNCLNSVQSYIVNKDEHKAIRYLSDFGKLIRSSLNFSLQETIPVDDELEMLKIFLDFEKQRLGDKMSYSINIDSSIDTEMGKIPPMIIQPFVENSIKHGIDPKKDKGYINISFSESDNNSELICIIEDDGVGRNNGDKKNAKSGHKSLGQKLTGDRLKVFEKKYKKEFFYEIIDLTKNNKPVGTKVKIKLPYIIPDN